jgi:glucosamine-6-phosphate deaminase
MEVIVKDGYESASRLAAEMIAQTMRSKPRAVLGLATGSTPLGAYRELVRMHREDGLDFSQTVTFNLDEYVGIPTTHEQSYRRFMDDNLFSHVNIRRENTHVPDGLADDVAAACDAYEAAIAEHGGIDLQLLGIGSNGHIAFNEPGSSLASRTRVKTLSRKTREDNARFFKSIDEVPRHAVTMGIGTVLDARRIILVAAGAGKAAAVAAAAEGPVTAMCPASILQAHRFVTFIVDRDAAGGLCGEYLSTPQRLIMRP